MGVRATSSTLADARLARRSRVSGRCWPRCCTGYRHPAARRRGLGRRVLRRRQERALACVCGLDQQPSPSQSRGRTGSPKILWKHRGSLLPDRHGVAASDAICAAEARRCLSRSPLVLPSRSLPHSGDPDVVPSPINNPHRSRTRCQRRRLPPAGGRRAGIVVLEQGAGPPTGTHGVSVRHDCSVECHPD